MHLLTHVLSDSLSLLLFFCDCCGSLEERFFQSRILLFFTRFFLIEHYFCCIFKTSGRPWNLHNFQQNRNFCNSKKLMPFSILICTPSVFADIFKKTLFFSRSLRSFSVLVLDTFKSVFWKKNDFFCWTTLGENLAPYVESRVIAPLFFFYWKHFDHSKKGLFFSWTLTLEVKVLFWMPLNWNGLFLFQLSKANDVQSFEKNNKICALFFFKAEIVATA